MSKHTQILATLCLVLSLANAVTTEVENDGRMLEGRMLDDRAARKAQSMIIGLVILVCVCCLCWPCLIVSCGLKCASLIPFVGLIFGCIDCIVFCLCNVLCLIGIGMLF